MNTSKIPGQGKQSNNVIVSHTSDLDGRISRELYVYFTGISADTPTIWVEYGELIEKAQKTITEWATGRDVVILDFSMTQQFIEEVAEVANSVELFDHHTGTKKLIAPDNCTIVCDTDESTVSLLWKHFRKSEKPTFIEICKDIDLHMIEKPDILSHKIFFDTIFFDEDKNKQDYLRTLLSFYSQPRHFYITQANKQLELAEKLANQAVINRADRTASILRPDKYKNIDTDIIAHYMLKNKDIDFAIISFDLVDKGLRISSVRKLKSCTRSLEEYCQARGGGGRETAGAFRESLADLNDDAFFTICGGLR